MSGPASGGAGLPAAEDPSVEGVGLPPGARLLRAAAPAERPSPLATDAAGLAEATAAALRGFDRRAANRPDLRQAAVGLVLIEDAQGRPCFLLTRRTSSLRAHPGQFALPGGRLDGDETPTEAALREVHEEIGLLLGPGAVLGQLDDFVSRSGYVMTPIVAWGGVNPALAPAPDEVEILHVVPLTDIDIEPRLIGIPESDRPVIQLPLFGNFVHAPTAAIIFQFREVVLQGRPTRVDHLEQPVFAWR
jgi:8-oxo-dGTP pyrophosphatase MutT (NUDIX family)